jgi:hypothetical protein
MDDIVYMLRNNYKPDSLHDLCIEAAMEIEQLRIKIDMLLLRMQGIISENQRLERLSHG